MESWKHDKEMPPDFEVPFKNGGSAGEERQL